MFDSIKGLINSIDAPAVPNKFAMTAPRKRIKTFFRGVAFPFTFMKIPPDTTNRLNNKAIKLIYSENVWSSSAVSGSANK